MSKLTGKLLQQNTAYSGAAPTLDLAYGGQFGFAPNLAQWINNQAYVRRDISIILLDAPKVFKRLPQSQKWYQALKALLELHPTSIEGFNAGLEVTTAGHTVGNGSEEQQEVTNVVRARTEPVFNFTEKEGNPIQQFLQSWITMGLMDPDTKYPGAITLDDIPPDYLADQYSASILAFEPDNTFKNVRRAWVTTNFFPLSTGDILGSRNKAEDGTLLELSINFSGLSEINEGTRRFAQEILTGINHTGANPYTRTSFINTVDESVKAVDDTTGYAHGVDQIAQTQVT